MDIVHLRVVCLLYSLCFFSAGWARSGESTLAGFKQLIVLIDEAMQNLLDPHRLRHMHI